MRLTVVAFAWLLVICSGCAMHGQNLPVRTQAQGRSVESTSLGQTTAIAIAGILPSTGADGYTPNFKWMIDEQPETVTQLNQQIPYTDVYVSAIREKESDYQEIHPSIASVDAQETAFWHSADPASLTLAPQNGKVTLHWQPDGRGADGHGLTIGGYWIYAGPVGGTMSRIASVNAATTSYAVSGLTSGAAYTFAVKSILNGNAVSYSWNATALAANPSNFALDSPQATLSATVKPGATLSLTVSVHVDGTQPSSLMLQTLVKPQSSTQTPRSTTMSTQGGGQYAGTATVTIPNGFNGRIAYRIMSTDGTISLPATGSGTYYLIPTVNNRIHWGNYVKNYAMNPGSVAWQRLLAGFVNSFVPQYGYRGVFFDDNIETFARVRPDAYPPNYSDASYLAAVKSEYAYLRAVIPSQYAMTGNGFSVNSIAQTIWPYVQRAEVEEFAYDKGGYGYSPPAFWTQNMNNVLAYNAKTPARLLRLVVIGQEFDANVRTWALANYYLVSTANTYYDYDVAYGDFFPETRVVLGAASQTFSTISAAFVAADGAYERTFSNGRVIVNSSNTTGTPLINLGRTYYKLVITGGDAQDGGAVSSVPVTSVQLAPDQAVILLNSPL